MWIFNGNEFTEDDIGDFTGFVYLIREIDTDRLYIGQKVFFNRVARKPLKGKKNRRISKKFSDWETYYGSNDELKKRVNELGVDNYRREIIRLCQTKSEMNYYETYEIITRNALLKEQYYNSWISMRINKNQLKSLRE